MNHIHGSAASLRRDGVFNDPVYYDNMHLQCQHVSTTEIRISIILKLLLN